MKAAIVLLLSALALTACGKKGPPDPPGPASEVIYPHAYPPPGPNDKKSP